MRELNRLTVELIQLNQEINQLFAKKRKLEEDMATVYKSIMDVCASTGKTIDDFEEV